MSGEGASANAATVGSALDCLLAECPVTSTAPEVFLGRQFDLGLAWVHFRVGEGGLELPAAMQELASARLFPLGAPNAFHLNAIGFGMVAPTIHTHGTQEQRARLLRPLFTGEEIWCQLFSEPGAGSDLAGVSTRAVPVGNEWVLDGQKVWTSYAHRARWGLLLARTDPDLPKHRGLTAFVVDMTAPGVEVRPLFQMTGEAEFNEVFFSSVRVPDSQRLGEVGDGWRVAITTLMNERVAIGGQVPEPGSGLIAEARAAWERTGRRDAVRRDRLAQLWIRSEILRITNIRAQGSRSTEGPGVEGSLSKLASAELNMDLTDFILELLGPESMLKPDGYPLERSRRSGFEFGEPVHDFLRARANSIEGGTSEIARNVLAERSLGLPPEIRTDKEIPWRLVPRS